MIFFFLVQPQEEANCDWPRGQVTGEGNASLTVVIKVIVYSTSEDDSRVVEMYRR